MRHACEQEAAELLKSTAEYTCLQPRQRLLILRSLLELALNSEVMRDYALQKVRCSCSPIGALARHSHWLRQVM